MNTNPKDKSSENVNKKQIEGKKCPTKLVLSEVLFEERAKNTENHRFGQSKTVPEKISTQGEKNIVVKKCEICDKKNDRKDKIKKSKNEEADKIKSKKCLTVKCPTKVTPVDTELPKLSNKTQIIKCRAKTQSGTKNSSEQRDSSALSTHFTSYNKNSSKQKCNLLERNPTSNFNLQTTKKIEVTQDKNKKSSPFICSASNPQASKTKVSSMEKNSYPKQTKLNKYEVAKLSNECVCPKIHPSNMKKCSANKQYAQQKYSLRKSFLKCLSSVLTEIQKVNIIPALQKLQLSDDEIEEQAISINNSVCPYKCSSPAKIVTVESEEVEITENIPESSTPSENEFSLKQKVTPCKSICNRQINEHKKSDHIVNKESESSLHGINPLDESIYSTPPPITQPSLKFIFPPSTSLKNIDSFVCPTACPSTKLSATNTEIGGIKEPCKSITCTTPKVIECKSVVCNPKPKIICQSKVCGVKSELGYEKRIVTERKPITELDVEVVWKPEKVAGAAMKPEEALEMKPATKLGKGVEEGQLVGAEVSPEVISVEPGVKPVVGIEVEPFVKPEFKHMVTPADRTEIRLDEELAAKPEEKLAEKFGVQTTAKPVEKVESELKPLGEAAVKPSVEPAVMSGELVVKPGVDSTVEPIVEPSVKEESGLKPLGEVAVKPIVEPAVEPEELVVKPRVQSTVKPIVEPSVKDESGLKAQGEFAVKPTVEPTIEPEELVVKPGVQSTVKPIVEPSVKDESGLKAQGEVAVKPTVEPAVEPEELVVKPGVLSTVKPIVERSVKEFFEPVATQGLRYAEISEEPAVKPGIHPSDKPKVDTAIKPGDEYVVTPVEDLAIKPDEGSKGIDSAVIRGKEQIMPSEVTGMKSGAAPTVPAGEEYTKKSREDSTGLPAAKLDMEAATKLMEDPAMQLKVDIPMATAGLIPEVKIKRQEREKAELGKSMQPLDSKIEKPIIGFKTLPGSESAKKSREDLPVAKFDMEPVTKLREDPASQLKVDKPKEQAGLIPDIVTKRQEGEKAMQPLDSKIEKSMIGSKTVPGSESAKKSREDLTVAKLDMEPATKVGKDPAMQLNADTPKVRAGLIPGIEINKQEEKKAKLDKALQPLDSKQGKKQEITTGTEITTQSQPGVEPYLKTTTKQAKDETDLSEKSTDTKQKQLADVESIPVDEVLKKEPAESKLSPAEAIISKSELKPDTKQKSKLDSVSKVEKVIGKISESKAGAKIDSPLALVEVEVTIESGKVETETLDKKEKKKAIQKLDTGHKRADKQDEKMTDLKAEGKISKADEDSAKTEAYSESRMDKLKIDKEKEKQKGKVEAKGKDKEREKYREKEDQLKSKADFGKPDAELDGEKLKPKLDSRKFDATTDEKSGQQKIQTGKFDTFDRIEKPELILVPKADSKILDVKPHDEKRKLKPKPKADSEKFVAKPQETKEKSDLKSKAAIQKERKIYEFDKEKSEIIPKPKDIETKEKLKSAAGDKKTIVKPEEKTEIELEDGSKISKAVKDSEKQTEREKSAIKIVSEKGETVGTKDALFKEDREADEKLISKSQLDGTERTTEQLSELAPETTDQVIAAEKDVQFGVTPEEPTKILDEEKKQTGKLGIEDKKGTEGDRAVVESRYAQGQKISEDVSVQKQKLGAKIKERKPLGSETFDKESEGEVPAAYSEKQIKSKIESEKLDSGQGARPVDITKKHKYVAADESEKYHKDDVLGKGESIPKTLKKSTKCACTQLRSRKTKRPILTQETCFCDKGLVTELSEECTCHKSSKHKQYTCAQTETMSKSFKSASCSTVEQNFRDRIRFPKVPDRHFNSAPCRTEYLPFNMEKGRPAGTGQLESQSFSGVPIPRFKDTRRSYCKCREDPNFTVLLNEMLEGTTKLMDSKRQEINKLLLHCTCDKNKEELDFAKVLLQLLDELGFQKKVKQKCNCVKNVHKRKLSKQGFVSCTCPVGGPSKSMNNTTEKEKVGDIGKVRCVDTCSRKKCTCLSALQRLSDFKLIQSERKTMQ